MNKEIPVGFIGAKDIGENQFQAPFLKTYRISQKIFT